mmetsp:Transcript_139630/g.197740  ORF Transcript_139630/g.197740 Transcript_139630/m.197740 type:complete len:185 (-) Transcript_139630:523-1077(-)
MSDYATGFQCNRWLMTVFFWLLDTVLQNCWVIAKFRFESDNPTPADKKLLEYKRNTKIRGRFRFQLDLANELIAYAKANALKEVDGDVTRVRWMNQSNQSQTREENSQHVTDSNEEEVHKLVTRGTKSYCQVCYAKLKHLKTQSEKKKASTRTDTVCCAASCGGKRMCVACFVEHHKAHGYPVA